MENLRKIIKESGISFSGSIAGMVLNYIVLILITRFLAPKEFGIFILAQTIINVSLVFVLFGTPRALDRYIPIFADQDEPGKIKTLIYDVLRITFGIALFFVIILFLGSEFISLYLFDIPELSSVMRIIVFVIPMMAFIQIVSFSFMGFKELRYHVYVQQLTFPILKIVFALAALILGFELLGWTRMFVISLVGTTFVAFLFFKTHILSYLSQVRRKSFSFKEIFAYSWPMSLGMIFLLLFGQFDLLFLGYYRSSEEVGIYKIYLQIAIILGFVLFSFGQIYKPIISGLIAKKKLDEVKDIYQRLTKWIFVIVAFGLSAIFLFGADIVGILFTEHYLVFPVALLILTLGRFVNSSVGPTGKTLEAFGNTKLWLLNTAMMFVVNITLNFLLIPKYGLIGAAISHATSLSVIALAELIEIYLLFRLQPFNREYFNYILTAIIATGLVFYVQSLIPEMNIITLVCLTILLLLLFITGLYLTKSFDDVDIEIMRAIKSKSYLRGKALRR